MQFNYKTLFVLPAVLASVSIADTAGAHMDVRPYASGGQIITGGTDDGTGDIISVVRVYGYDFGEEPADPFVIGDPGFNATNTSGLPAGSLKFNVLSSLLYWDGAGSPAFTAPISGESLSLRSGSVSRVDVTGSSAPGAGFTISAVSATGTLHKHLSSWLLGSDGNAVPADAFPSGDGITTLPGDGIEAATGVYAFAMELRVTGSTNDTDLLTKSDPFWFVYNNGLSEDAHDVAMEFIETNYVPEPTTAGLLMAGAAMLLRRRHAGRN